MKQKMSAKDFVLALVGVGFVGWGFHEGPVGLVLLAPVGVAALILALFEGDAYRACIDGIRRMASAIRPLAQFIVVVAVLLPGVVLGAIRAIDQFTTETGVQTQTAVAALIVIGVLALPPQWMERTKQAD